MFEGGAADRQKWRSHRNLVKGAFSAHAVKNMADKVWETANDFTASILNECGKNSHEKAGRGTYCADASDIFKWVTLGKAGSSASTCLLRVSNSTAHPLSPLIPKIYSGKSHSIIALAAQSPCRRHPLRARSTTP